MEENEITDEYDREFISLMLTIEKRSEILQKFTCNMHFRFYIK